MEYLSFSLAAFLALLLCGLPFSLLLTPAPLRRYAVLFGPMLGYSYLVGVCYPLYRSGIGSIDLYAGYLFLPPLLLGAWQMRRNLVDFRSLFSAETRSILLLYSFGVLVLALPFLIVSPHSATSFALNNLDVIDLSRVARYLENFRRGAAVGSLGTASEMISTCDYAWFGPSAIVAWVAAILHGDPGKLQCLVMNLLAAQGVPMIYLLAREVFTLDRRAAGAAALLAALSPLAAYTAWDGFGGQMISTPIILGLIGIVLAVPIANPGPRETIRAALLATFFAAAVLLTYHYLLVLLLALLAVYTTVDRLLFGARSRALTGFGIALAAVAAAGALYPQRVSGFFHQLAMLSRPMGWFVPWLGPGTQIGLTSGKLLIRHITGAQAMPTNLLAAALLILIVAQTLLARPRHQRLSSMLGLALPVFILSLYYAMQEARAGVWGGYRSFKIAAIFMAFPFLTILSGLAGWEAAPRRAARWISRSIYGLLLISSAWGLGNLCYYLDLHRPTPVDQFLPLRQIERMPQISGINIPDNDYVTLFWINYATLDKAEVFQRFPYGGIAIGPLDYDYYLTLKQRPDSREIGGNILWVELPPGTEEIPIDPSFSLFRPDPAHNVILRFGAGWPMLTHPPQWSGADGSKATVIAVARTRAVVSLHASMLPLRPGEILSVAVDGAPLALVHSDSTAFDSVPFSIEPGETTISFSSNLPPVSSPKGGEPHGVCWKRIALTFEDANYPVKKP